ncbi:MAG TPA: hypothetical protein VF355_07110 [Anaerolineaceae bacterium]
MMPNHLHGIIILQDGDGMGDDGNDGDADGRGEASGNDIRGSKTRYFPDASPLRTPRVKLVNRENLAGRPNGTESGSLGAIIQNFKSITTRRVNGLRPTALGYGWQPVFLIAESNSAG